MGTFVLNLAQKWKPLALFSNLEIWSSLFIICFFLIFFEKSAEMMLMGKMLSIGISAVTIQLFIFFHITKSNKSQIKNQERLITVGKFCLPVALSQIPLWGLNSGFRLPLNFNGGAINVGIYSVIYSIIVALFGFFQTIFSQLYEPIFWNEVTQKGVKSASIEKFVKNHWPILIFFTAFIIGSAKLIILIFVAVQYQKYYALFMILAVGECLRHMSACFSCTAYALDKPKLLITPGIVSAFIGLSGSLILGFWGNPILSTAISMTLAYFVYMLYVWICIKKEVLFFVPLKKMYLGIFICMAFAMGLFYLIQTTLMI